MNTVVIVTVNQDMVVDKTFEVTNLCCSLNDVSSWFTNVTYLQTFDQPLWFLPSNLPMESLFFTFNHIAKASGCNYVLSIPMGDYRDLVTAIAWKFHHRSKQNSSRANLVIIYASSSSMLYRIIVVHHVIESRLYSS